jgi:histidyl-tRNA synthetase
MIEMALAVLDSAGLKGTQLLIDSVGDHTCRPQFISALRERLRDVAPQMCSDCQRRAVTNPLRVLDCKVPADQPIIDLLPSILDYLCDVCKFSFDRVQLRLRERDIPFEVRPRLVRGLDYYKQTTFEVVHGKLGAQSAVLGGGRYDGIAEAIGSKIPAPGVGFSIGEDRLVMLLEEAGAVKTSRLDVFIAFVGSEKGPEEFQKESERILKEATLVARYLRQSGISVELGDGRLKRGLELANKMGARFALILGDNEIANQTYLLKDMSSTQQESLSRGQLVARIKK